MILRPRPARWFELLTAREELTAVLECLAATGLVELEAHSDASAAHTLPVLRAALDEFRTLKAKHAVHWPTPQRAPVQHPQRVEEIPREAMRRIRTWTEEADAALGELQQLDNEFQELALIDELLECDEARLPNLAALGNVRSPLAGRLYAGALDAGTVNPPPAVLLLSVVGPRHRFLLCIGPEEQIAALDEAVAGLEARRIVPPRDLPDALPEARNMVARRRATLALREAELVRCLDGISKRHELASALGDMAFVEWLANEVPELRGTENFAWLTGWTSDPDGTRLRAALDVQDLGYLLHFPDSPSESQSPVILRNPGWARPFEIFAGLLGVPGTGEADPSAVVAFIAPLLFGFMFGDVGQGAVLIVAGLFLRRRLPALSLLVPGGIMAMLFGVAFGSVFALEGVVPALWLHPLSAPLVILKASLALGATLVVLGLLLDALQAHWCGRSARWWSTRGGVLLAFVSLLAATSEPRALLGALAGVLWFLAGELASQAGQPLARLGAALGTLLETLLQMLVNTISFVRVGAFALAHAGLASAIIGIAAACESATARSLALIVGNALVIGLEGLIVGIQTTRLVLFEFFIRFLKGEGRPFRPLRAPAPGMRSNQRTLS